MAKSKSYKEQFITLFNSLCVRHSRFTVWSDCIHMWAYTISNSCDYRQDREDSYMAIVKRYTKTEIDKLPKLFAIVVMAVDENRQQDFLGQLYMEFGFGDTKKGEYFTPYNIALMMARITNDAEIEKKRYVTVNDPTCGSGVMLIAYANKLREEGYNHHLKMLVVANDIDPCIALMCFIQLSLLGCAGYVCIRNSLTEPVTGDLLRPPKDAFILPLFFHPIWMLRRNLKCNNLPSEGRENI